MTTAWWVDGYRTARQAQDERLSRFGDVDASETGTEEFAQYFGLGKEWLGKGTEQRITPRLYMKMMAGERQSAEQSMSREGHAMTTTMECITMESAFYLTGADLAALAEAGDRNAQAEIERRAAKRAAKRAGKGKR